ncbi:hypothetical protein BU26DRAFT_40534 [Trematosphaeria pertusa]|uniref:Uncharacterized protein n=1 Tax=Trematosphaeria pertusa TaxID=390896 RepID=A0A6A6J366_9PLEO|nr:uncharacterized protein BU26DRAFT_40534 [Trematosphaeria pertusa]KAF2257285.1 hypothetical protein BU26DRAFT_40534 [Trematosphaeria pertusa]
MKLQGTHLLPGQSGDGSSMAGCALVTHGRACRCRSPSTSIHAAPLQLQPHGDPSASVCQRRSLCGLVYPTRSKLRRWSRADINLGKCAVDHLDPSRMRPGLNLAAAHPCSVCQHDRALERTARGSAAVKPAVDVQGIPEGMHRHPRAAQLRGQLERRKAKVVCSIEGHRRYDAFSDSHRAGGTSTPPSPVLHRKQILSHRRTQLDLSTIRSEGRIFNLLINVLLHRGDYPVDADATARERPERHYRRPKRLSGAPQKQRTRGSQSS